MQHSKCSWLVLMVAAALLTAGLAVGTQAEPLPGGSLDPTTISKYTESLFIPPEMPKTSTSRKLDYYEIAVRQFEQQVLPAGLPPTTVWGYGSVNHPGTFSYPAHTIEAKVDKPLRVKWINDLKDENGNYRPHLLPVDPTLHWANPPGGKLGRDMRPIFELTPGPYTGPVPMVAHLHGAHVDDDSDGYPEAWFLPDANNIPEGHATHGSWYNFFKGKNFLRTRVQWEKGTSVFQYRNDQRAATLWFHDHTLGMTRVNVYAGPAGFYLIRGGAGDRNLGYRAPKVGDPEGVLYTEIPLVVQDRSFNADGSLFYPDTREFFDEYPGPFVPATDVPPIWNPEFFGNTMVVNGKTWPVLNVEQRRYRFRFLNASDSRFLILKMDNGQTFWQIGSDGGFLPAPVEIAQLLIAPAERTDVIVDFTNLPAGTEIILQNLGPDEPFGGGEPGVDFDPADPGTTGQVMKFVVVQGQGQDKTAPPAQLKLPAFTSLAKTSKTRQVSLNEEMSSVFDGPIAAKLGVMDGAGSPIAKLWMDAVTENPKLNVPEIWEIFNFTADAHPIHVHQTMFQVISREPLAPVDEEGVATPPAFPTGDARGPEVGESGFKDTVISYPGEVTRIKVFFDIPGLYVWHCHILSHEDNEMMRPFFAGTSNLLKVPYIINAAIEDEKLF